MKHIFVLALILIANDTSLGQRTDLPKTTVLKGTTSTGATTTASLITSNLGGTANCSTNCSNGTDTGNSNTAFFSPFVTPLNSQSWASVGNVFWSSPASGQNGFALYGDTTSGCTSGSPHCPGTLICGATSSSTPSTGWNTYPISGCGTPSSNTWYWAALVTASNTQNQGTSGVSSYCPGTSLLVSGYATSVSSNPWPSTAPTLTGSPLPSGTDGNGCYSAYIQVNSTTTAQYNVVSIVPGQCDASTASCVINIPPTQANDALYVFTASSGSADTISTVTDAINGTATDTLTQRGTCPGISGGEQVCIFSINRVSTGVNSINCTYSSFGKVQCVALEVSGTLASGSFDQANYDTTATVSQSFTGATITTTHNRELIVANVFDSNQPGTVYGEYPFSIGSATGWTIIYQGGTTGNDPSTQAIYIQSVTSIGTYGPTGTASCCSTGNSFASGVASFQ